MLTLLARWTSDRPGRLLGALAGLTILLGVFAVQQTTDSGLRAFAPDSDRARALDRVQEEFGATGVALQVVVDAGPGGDVLTPDGFALAGAVEDALRAAPVALAPGDAAIRSYATPLRAAFDAVGLDATEVSSEAVDVAARVSLVGRAAQLVSTDLDLDAGRARAGLVVASLPGGLDDDAAATASLALADAVADVDAAGFDVAPFNVFVLNDALEEEAENEMPRLLALSLLLILGILLAQFRRVSDVVVGIVGLVAAIVWMTGVAVLLGPDYLGLVGPFTQISLVVPVLIVGLGIDFSIHLTSRYREERAHGADPPGSARMAVRTVGGALVLATATTVVGFLTNIASPLPPVSDFGIFTAVGVVSAFVVMAVLVPSVRNLLDRRGAERASRTRRRARPDAPAATAPAVGRLVGRAAFLAQRAPRVTLAIAAVVSALAIGGGSQVGTTFSQQEFIPEDSDVGDLVARIDRLFGGDVTETTYVILDGDVTDPEVVTIGVAVLEALTELPEVRVVDGAAQADPFLAESGDAAVLALATRAGQDGAGELRRELERRAAPLADAGLAVTVTSEPIVIDETLGALTASQSRGILVTLLAALGLLVATYGARERRPVLGAIAMVPSVAVVTWVVGTMWLLGLNFNVLTIMVASIGIGIGVPFGIHVTHRFLEDRRRYDTVDEALTATLTHTGGAMAGSAATTAAGFGVLVLASLTTMQQFGTIVAVTIVYSFLAAILVQPACLKLWAEHRARRGDTGELRDHERRAHDRETSAPVAGARAEPADPVRWRSPGVRM